MDGCRASRNVVSLVTVRKRVSVARPQDTEPLDATVFGNDTTAMTRYLVGRLGDDDEKPSARHELGARALPIPHPWQLECHGDRIRVIDPRWRRVRFVVTSNGLDHNVSYDSAGNETSYLASYSPRNLMTTVTDTSGEGTAHQISYGYDYRGIRVSRTESPTDAGSASRYFFYTPEFQLLASTVDDSTNLWGQSTHHTMTLPDLAMNREIIWFAGAPVAEIGPPRTPDDTTIYSRHRTFDTGTATNTFYTFTDHLGTPLIQTDPTTAIVWRAEHEPYGNVYLMRKGSRTDQPLRFPGQEAAMTWEGTEENYNVFRWYRAGWGRYTQGDPAGLDGGINVYSYADDGPLTHIDRTGLSVRMCCRPINGSSSHNHCYFEFSSGRTLGLYPSKTSIGTLGLPSPNNPGDKNPRECGGWTDNDSCVQRYGMAHPPFAYSILGPNSNTYARCISGICGIGRPGIANEIDSPGWNSQPQWKRCQDCNNPKKWATGM